VTILIVLCKQDSCFINKHRDSLLPLPINTGVFRTNLYLSDRTAVPITLTFTDRRKPHEGIETKKN